MEEAKITFYNVRSCGYYQHGEPNDPLFGGIADTLGHLRQWILSRPLAHTKTHDANDGGNELPAYLKDVSQLEDSWLLTLWNESPTTDGKLISINGFALPGQANVSETEVDVGHIPGHATYFWIVPSMHVLATVRFQHPVAGMNACNMYVQGFLATWGPHVVHEDSHVPGSVQVAGYRASEGDAVGYYRPSFKAEIFKKPGPVDYIVSRAAAIRKIRKKAKLNLNHQDRRAWWQRLRDELHLSGNQIVTQEVGVQYEMDVQGLTAEEVQSIVTHWVNDDGDDDYGFVLAGEANKTYWLKRSYAKDTLDLDIIRENVEIVDPQSLLRELHRYRPQLIQLME